MTFDLAPLVHVSLVEFPCNVTNVDRAVECLQGGRDSLIKTIASKGKDPLELRLRPNDPFHHPVRSSPCTARQILLEIKIPKRNIHNDKANVSFANKHEIQTAMKNAADRVVVRPCAIIDVSLRFHDMADFQVNTINNTWISHFKHSVLAGDLDSIMQLNVARPINHSLDPHLMVPPPQFSSTLVPFKYNFKDMRSSSSANPLNNRTPIKLYSQNISWLSTIPTSPSTHLQPLDSLSTPVLQCIDHLKTLFQIRPCWLRTGLKFHTPTNLHPVLKLALPYICYSFRSGPWRNTCLLFGTDPATNSTVFAPLQTESFRLKGDEEEDDDEDDEDQDQDQEKPDYQFDGVHLPKSRQFQLCDITEPNVVKIMAHPHLLRTQCHPIDGWIKEPYIKAIREIVRIRLAIEPPQKQKQQQIHHILSNLDIN